MIVCEHNYQLETLRLKWQEKPITSNKIELIVESIAILKCQKCMNRIEKSMYDWMNKIQVRPLYKFP